MVIGIGEPVCDWTLAKFEKGPHCIATFTSQMHPGAFACHDVNGAPVYSFFSDAYKSQMM